MICKEPVMPVHICDWHSLALEWVNFSWLHYSSQCSSLWITWLNCWKWGLTPEFAERTCSNCLTNFGGDILSISAPSIEIGHLTSDVILEDSRVNKWIICNRTMFVHLQNSQERSLTFDIINGNKRRVQQYSSLDLMSFCQLHNNLCWECERKANAQRTKTSDDKMMVTEPQVQWKMLLTTPAIPCSSNSRHSLLL